MAVQACHWFDMTAFVAEARRVLSPGGALALVGYRLPAPVWHGTERDDVRELLAQVRSAVAWCRTGVDAVLMRCGCVSQV